MEKIAHRRNTRAELLATPDCHGVEVDIRTWGDQLIIHHDPCVKGECFESWLSAYRHGTLILNVKEEGLESRLITLLAQHTIERYFFLDQSFPFLIRTAQQGERRCAVRFSEFESIETVLALAGKIDWVWVDCFTHMMLTAEQATTLSTAGFKLCLVSPELQGRDPVTEIPAFVRCLAEHAIQIDAVCTKRPDLWETID